MPAEYSCDEMRRRMSSSSSSTCGIKPKQPGVAPSLLHSGSTFRGQQRSQGNSYQVDVVLQVGLLLFLHVLTVGNTELVAFINVKFCICPQYVFAPPPP